MKDRDRIFYDVVTELSRSDVDIVNAQLLNASDGYALQTFRLAPIKTDNEEMSLIADQIKHSVDERLNRDTDTTPATMTSSGKYKYFSSPTIISFKKVNDNTTTQIKIETINRAGVLATIAKVFIDCKFKILSARIVTAGEKAIDIFNISTELDDTLSNEQQNDLKQQLKELL